jgi:hypothetical protein
LLELKKTNNQQNCWKWWAWELAWTTNRISFLEENNSESRLPEHYPICQKFCCWTNPRTLHSMFVDPSHPLRICWENNNNNRGDLDQKNTIIIMKLLHELNKKHSNASPKKKALFIVD